MTNNYLKRLIDKELLLWKNEPGHKPLLLRGARQVGKSSSVRQLAESKATPSLARICNPCVE